MGVAWLLDVPALIRKRFGASVPGDRTDPRIKDDESVRAPLQMLSNLLNLWERHRIGDLLDAALAEALARSTGPRREGRARTCLTMVRRRPASDAAPFAVSELPRQPRRSAVSSWLSQSRAAVVSLSRRSCTVTPS